MKINNVSKYIFELAVIFIGITLSFWVENFRESRQEREIEGKYLRGFQADFKHDKEELIKLKGQRQTQKKSAYEILKFFNGDKLVIDSFYTHYYAVLPYYRFVPNTNTLEEVINSSHLRILSDDSIKANILEIRAMYERIKTLEDHIYHDQVTYMYDNGFGTIDLSGYILLLNKESLVADPVHIKAAEKLLRDQQQKNAYFLMAINIDELFAIYDPAIKKCDLIIKQIKEKLKD